MNHELTLTDKGRTIVRCRTAHAMRRVKDSALTYDKIPYAKALVGLAAELGAITLREQFEADVLLGQTDGVPWWDREVGE